MKGDWLSNKSYIKLESKYEFKGVYKLDVKLSRIYMYCKEHSVIYIFLLPRLGLSFVIRCHIVIIEITLHVVQTISGLSAISLLNSKDIQYCNQGDECIRIHIILSRFVQLIDFQENCFIFLMEIFLEKPACWHQNGWGLKTFI